MLFVNEKLFLQFNLEVNLSAFIYRLLHEDFSPIVRVNPVKSLYIILPIELSTTCDSRTQSNYAIYVMSNCDGLD